MPKRTRTSRGAYGSKYKRRRPYKKVPRRRKKFSRAAVKSVVMSLSESKNRDRSVPFETADVEGRYKHNSLYVAQLHNASDSTEGAHVTSVAQGDEQYQRNGREIYSTGFMVRGQFAVPYDRRNVTVKIWLVSFNSAQGSPLDPSKFFKTITGNNMLDGLNSDRFPGVRLMKTLRTTARDLYVERGEITDAGAEATMRYNFWIPWKSKCTYAGSTAVGPKSGFKETLWLIMLPYDTSATLSTDAVLTHNEQRITWYYKDP